MVNAYAKALMNLRSQGMSESEAYTKLLAHLKETGRLKLLPQLLRALRIEASRQSAREPLLEVASEGEAKAAQDESGTKAEAQVNPSLIRGWRLVSGDTLTDRSGKRALIDLYRSITRAT